MCLALKENLLSFLEGVTKKLSGNVKIMPTCLYIISLELLNEFQRNLVWVCVLKYVEQV
jgi:hypothetical protein